MPSYRFCRPDDIPFLVRAINECYNPHFSGEPEMTVERFRQEMKERSLWPSNSMVAIAGTEPIAVMIGSKRESEVMVLRVGVRRDHQREGHGGHILTSLSQKLAVLGPPRLLAEIPEDLPAARALFRSLGYRKEAVYRDYSRPAGGGRDVPQELVAPIGVEELMATGALVASSKVAWDRGLETLQASEDSLEGLAITSPARIEAYLLYRGRREEIGEGREAGVEILCLHAADPARAEQFSSLLVEALALRTGSKLVFPKLAVNEVPEGLLGPLGFSPGRAWERLAAVAKPG